MGRTYNERNNYRNTRNPLLSPDPSSVPKRIAAAADAVIYRVWIHRNYGMGIVLISHFTFYHTNWDKEKIISYEFTDNVFKLVYKKKNVDGVFFSN